MLAAMPAGRLALLAALLGSKIKEHSGVPIARALPWPYKFLGYLLSCIAAASFWPAKGLRQERMGRCLSREARAMDRNTVI